MSTTGKKRLHQKDALIRMRCFYLPAFFQELEESDNLSHCRHRSRGDARTDKLFGKLSLGMFSKLLRAEETGPCMTEICACFLVESNT
jgi:hypothetical protein